MFLSDDNKSKDAPFTPTLRGKQLLLDPDTRRALQEFRSTIPLTDSDYQQYYVASVEGLAEYVQNLPATRYSLCPEPYGFLHLSLDRAILCTKQALKAYYDIQHLPPEQLSSYQHAELFAVFSAALLNDLGVLNLRFQIQLKTRSEQIIPYDPYAGPMPTLGKAFCFEFLKIEHGDWQAPASLVLARQVLAHTGQNYKYSAFAWLSNHHQILQFWYNLMLSISPREEDETRRTLLTLIPRSSAHLLDRFINNANQDNRGSFLTQRPYNPLFNDSLINNNELRDETNDLINSDYEHATDGMASTDATNSRTLGSYGAANAPRLTVGLAFLRWLQKSLQSGIFRGDDEQAAHIFRTDHGLVLNWDKLTAAYAKHQSHQKEMLSSSDVILKGLRHLAVSSAQGLNLRDFSLRTQHAKINFQGLVFDNPYILYGNKALPPLSLGLAEVEITHASPVYSAKAEPKVTLE